MKKHHLILCDLPTLGLLGVFHVVVLCFVVNQGLALLPKAV